ncbi:hypothetical protein Q7A53_05185 [Halobacillus rhizosphaerae]|uniref:hypothetical protein n=1 Tax=Halobacillus rhizosphaerae TaxID=3064889 RepID=UPI00398BA687
MGVKTVLTLFPDSKISYECEGNSAMIILISRGNKFEFPCHPEVARKLVKQLNDEIKGEN